MTLDYEQAIIGRGPDRDVQANEEAMKAVKEIRKIGKKLFDQVEILDQNRQVLKDHNIEFNPRFDAPVQAAIELMRKVK